MDPTCGGHLKEHGPSVVAWLERMLDPKREGPFESLASLEESLRRICEEEVGPRFLAWDAANAEAWEAGAECTELAMDGRRCTQRTVKYPAHTLGILRGKYAAVADDAQLAGFLEETGCRRYLV